MRVAVTGATGFVGREVVHQLRAAGHDVVALTRDADRARGLMPEGVDVHGVDPYDPAQVRAAIEGCEGVVNLAGESIFAHRWTKRFKEVLFASRVETTRALVEAIRGLAVRPEVLVSASAVGIYGPREPDDAIDEDRLDADRFGPDDVLANICRHWEHQAREAERLGVRVVRLRVGVVLGPGGGALQQIEKPFKMFVGGPVGRGRQVMSWVHLEDLGRLVVFCLEHREARGVVHAVAPGAVSNKELSRTLAFVLGRPCLFPVPPPALRLALGEVASVVTTGQRVVPRRAEQLGFSFRYPLLERALRSIYAVEPAA